MQAAFDAWAGQVDNMRNNYDRIAVAINQAALVAHMDSALSSAINTYIPSATYNTHTCFSHTHPPIYSERKSQVIDITGSSIEAKYSMELIPINRLPVLQ